VRLGWVCAAHRADGDQRALGLPVSSLAWIREDSPVSRLDERAAAAIADVVANAGLT
jgi:hypothetical protein